MYKKLQFEASPPWIYEITKSGVYNIYANQLIKPYDNKTLCFSLQNFQIF